MLAGKHARPKFSPLLCFGERVCSSFLSTFHYFVYFYKAFVILCVVMFKFVHDFITQCTTNLLIFFFLQKKFYFVVTNFQIAKSLIKAINDLFI